jgi:hypothetical protein
MGSLFISYRREDAAGHAGRLEEALEAHFGAGRVFRDVADLTPGAAFPAVLERRLAQADAVLVLIGPRWLEAARDGQRRLEQADDYVRLEVARALHSGKPVVPVLLEGALMPRAAQLPEPLHGLAERHAARLTDAGWHDDVARLAATLETWLGPATRRRPRRRALLALAGGLLAGAGGLAWLVRTPFPAGRWVATVDYDWGVRQLERFEFERTGGSIAGTASFLGRPRAILSARWADGVLQFETRSESQMGEATRVLSHRYRMRPLPGGRWEVRYAIEGGFSPVTPMRFELRPAP